MRNAFPILLGVVLVGSLSACDSFVENVDGPVDRVVSDSLDNQQAVAFLATGVEEGFNDAVDASAVLATLLSDVGQFDQCVGGATFPTFGDIDRAEITFDNNSVDGVYNAINEARFLSDDLLRRANETITFSDDADGAEARRLALYTGNLYGGITRTLLAQYFGLTEEQGGSPIDASAFIPSSQLFADAITRLQAALDQASSDYERRVINSLIARAHLYNGNRAQAGAFAANGLMLSDAPFTADYASTSQNNYYTQAGQGRTQVSVSARFADDDDPRTSVEVAPSAAPCAGNGITYYRQAEYVNNDDPIPFISGEETALIRAEAALLEDDNEGAALGFVNSVRDLYDLDDLDNLDQDALVDERDKTLFGTGARLMDQRRFGIPFTYVVPGTEDVAPTPGGWRFLPVTQSERNANPNL